MDLYSVSTLSHNLCASMVWLSTHAIELCGTCNIWVADVLYCSNTQLLCMARYWLSCSLSLYPCSVTVTLNNTCPSYVTSQSTQLSMTRTEWFYQCRPLSTVRVAAVSIHCMCLHFGYFTIVLLDVVWLWWHPHVYDDILMYTMASLM